VENITFIFGTSPNTKPEEKKWGGMAYYIPPPEKVGGHVPRVPHQIAPMVNTEHESLRCLGCCSLCCQLCNDCGVCSEIIKLRLKKTMHLILFNNMSLPYSRPPCEPCTSPV